MEEPDQAPQDFCAACGERLDPGEEACPACGASADSLAGGRRQSSEKSTVIAVVLSLLITGVGHVYLGQITRGGAWLVGGIAAGVALSVVDLALLALVFPLGAAIDAGYLASRR